MKKTVIILLMLPLLTGCWDRIQLSNLRLVDIAGFDLDEENGDVVLHLIITKLKSAGQGTGEPISEIIKLKGSSLVEAVGQGEFTDQTPFLGISTGVYLISKEFASDNPSSKLAFLLKAPYSSVNTPLIVLDGNMSEFFNTESKMENEFTKNLYNFIFSFDKSGIASNVSIMEFILSQKEPLDDIALPMIKLGDSGIELSGALLFHNGISTGVKLSKEQGRMLMLLLDKDIRRQRFTGSLSVKDKTQQNDSEQSNIINYGFSIKTEDSKITVQSETSRLPKITIKVNLKINAFELGDEEHKLIPDYVNQMEKEMSRHLEEEMLKTIENIQKANSDVLGIGKHIKAYHPSIWRDLDWSKDFRQLSIEPKIDLQILNSDPE